MEPDAFISSAAGRRYWSGVDADVNGMLGGFPGVSGVDVRGSRAFLAKMGVGSRGGLRRVERVLEGGAGYVFFLLLPLLPYVLPLPFLPPSSPSYIFLGAMTTFHTARPY